MGMNVLDHFSIPIVGFKNGLHHLKFVVNDDFFESFNSSLVDNGHFYIDLKLDKKNDHTELNFFIKGRTTLACDRCLDELELELEGNFGQILKYGVPDSDADELMYLRPGESSVNVASFIYECICLMRPMVVKHEIIEDCDSTILEKLSSTPATQDIKNEWFERLKGINLLTGEQ